MADEEAPFGGVPFGGAPFGPGITTGGAEQVLTPSLYTNTSTVYAVTVYRTEALHPDADVADGGWTNEADSNVNLYASVDEVAINDSDYIKSGDMPTNDIVTLGLANPIGTPAQPFRVRYRYRKDTNAGGTMELKVRLLETTTEIAEWVHSDIGASFVDASQELSTPEFEAISNFDNLRVEFEATYV